MTYQFYAYLIMVGNNSDISLNALKDKLAKKFSSDDRSVELSIADEALLLRIDGYTFELARNEGEHIIEESRDIATKFVKDPGRKQAVENCNKWYEMNGDIDADMLYFNDSIAILETVGSFKNVYIFDTNNNEFMN